MRKVKLFDEDDEIQSPIKKKRVIKKSKESDPPVNVKEHDKNIKEQTQSDKENIFCHNLKTV